MTPHEEILAAHDYALVDPYVLSLSRNWSIWRALPMRYNLDNKPWRDLEEFRRAADQAERAIAIARRECALRHDDELIAFALHSLSYGEHFYRHPLIRRAFELRDQDPEGWRYDVQTLVITPDEWAAIAAAPQ